MRRNRLALLFVLFIAQAALAVPLAITTLGVSTSTPTTATITWTTTGTSAAADTRVSYTGGGITSAYIDGSRVTSHSATLTGLQPGVVYTYTASSQSATETATGTAATFSLCQPNSGKLTSVKATLYSFYAYGAFTATWHDLSGIGTTPTQCGVAITTPVSGTLDINGNLSVSLPDVNQVTPSVGAWTIAFSSFASTGSVSVDISPTGQNFDASATIQAQVTSGNKGPVGGSSGAGTGTVTSVTFTGDGVVDSSTPSAAVTTSGTVTGTIKTQTAHTFLGNNTGSTAAPVFAALALADLPGTVVNATSPGVGLAHFAGSTQTVTSSTVATGDIAANAVTLPKQATNTANTLQGFDNGGAAADVTIGSGLSLSGGSLSSTGSSGAMVQLETHTASSSATLDFTTCISGTTYHTFKFILRNVLPAATNNLLMLVSNDGGSTYQAGSGYFYGGSNLTTAGAGGFGVQGTSSWQISGATVLQTAALNGASGELDLFNPLGGTSTTDLVGHLGYYNGSGIENYSVVFANWNANTAVNAVRFKFAAGNIASGVITCYGITP
jgi:hypothetical protein